MSVRNWVVGILVLGSTLTSEVSAQDKAVGFTVRGGLFNGVGNLNDAKTHDLQKTGYDVGAGINFEVNKYVAIRGDVDLARNELQINDAETGRDLSRLFYDASIQFSYPIKSFKPYLFVGAGAVTLHPTGTDDADATKFAGTGGLGVKYAIPRTNLSFGVEGKSWFYKMSNLGGSFDGYDENQFDATWGAAITYRIPLGARLVSASR